MLHYDSNPVGQKLYNIIHDSFVTFYQKNEISVFRKQHAIAYLSSTYNDLPIQCQQRNPDHKSSLSMPDQPRYCHTLFG